MFFMIFQAELLESTFNLRGCMSTDKLADLRPVFTNISKACKICSCSSGNQEPVLLQLSQLSSLYNVFINFKSI